MRVDYFGATADSNYKRSAYISIDDDNPRECTLLDRTIHLIGIKYGWEVERVTPDVAICRLDDRADYAEFMKDWKVCKKCISNCIKFGF